MDLTGVHSATPMLQAKRAPPSFLSLDQGPETPGPGIIELGMEAKSVT